MFGSNFCTEKSTSTYVYLSTEWSKGARNIDMVKYYFILKQKNTFNLGLNTAKNTHQIKKKSNKSCFDLMYIFGSIDPQSESNFPFLYVIRFQTYWSLELPSFTPGETDIWAHRLFGTKFNSKQLLFEAFFDLTRIFGQRWDLNWMYFSVSV